MAKKLLFKASQDALNRLSDIHILLHDVDGVADSHVPEPLDTAFFNSRDGISRFIAERLGVSLDEGVRIFKRMTGLPGRAFANIEEHTGIPVTDLIDWAYDQNVLLEMLMNTPQVPELRTTMEKLTMMRHFFFTNGTRMHANRMLTRQSLLHRFERHTENGKVTIERGFATDDPLVNYRQKPDVELMSEVFHALDTHVDNIAFIEDSQTNAIAASGMGLLVILIKRGMDETTPKPDGIDIMVPDYLTALRVVLAAHQ